MMKKKTLIFGLVGVMGAMNLIPVYAIAENVDNLKLEPKLVAEVKQKVMSFSLDEAIEYALKNNRDIIIGEVELAKANTSYDDGMRGISSDEKNLKDMIKGDFLTGDAMAVTTININMIESGASRRIVELPYQIAKWDLEIKKNQVKYNVEKAYYDLTLLEKEFEISEENLNLSRKQYNHGKLKYDLGTISKQQLSGLEMGVLQAQTAYDSLVIDKELQVMSFQNILGLPFNQQIDLTDTIKYKVYKRINLNASIKLALENNTGIKTAQESYEISKLTLKAIPSRYSENIYRYRAQEADVAKAAENLEVAKNGVEIGVKSAYLNLLTAEKQIKTYAKTREEAEKALVIAELSFDLGQSTSMEITQANINLMNAKKNLSQQIHALNMALLDFEYSIGM